MFFSLINGFSGVKTTVAGDCLSAKFVHHGFVSGCFFSSACIIRGKRDPPHHLLEDVDKLGLLIPDPHKRHR